MAAERPQSIGDLLKFVKLTHEFQQVRRAVLVNSEERQENDLEHSGQLALIALYVCDTAKLPLNRGLVLEYALVHDLVEAYAGDTHFYDAAGRAGKKEREEAARLRLKQEFPEAQRFHELIEAYEAKADDESKFVYALDKLLPIVNIYLDKGRTWQVDGISFDALATHKAAPISVSLDIKAYYDQLLEILEQNKHIFSNSSTGIPQHFVNTRKGSPLSRIDTISIDIYNSHAQEFADKWDTRSARAIDIEKAFALANKRNPRVVELGFGSGRDAVEILKRTPHYVGIDAAPELQKIAQAKSPDGRFVLADFSMYELSQNSADIVFASASLIHFDKDGFFEMSKKVHEWLDTNGIFYLSLKRGSYGKISITDSTGTRFNYLYEIDDVLDLTKDLFEYIEGENQHLELTDRHRDQDWILVILRKK